MAKRQKTGGRRRGTPNKTTGEIKAVLQLHGEELIDALLALTKSDDERVRLGAITAALDRGYGKPAQAVAITGDPDSPVIFHLAMGDGLVPKVIDGEVVASEPLGKPLVAFSGSDDADSPV